MSSQLLAGFGRSDITPPLGTELFGYPTVRHGNDVDDRLAASALVLQQGDLQTALVSLDLCLLDETDVAAVRDDVEAATGIPAANVTISTTHTHSGPITVQAWGWGEKNLEYAESLRPLIVAAISQAKAALEPVQVGFAVTETLTGINRRKIHSDNTVGLGTSLWGALDKKLTVARFEGKNGTVASLIHLSAHPTSRGAQPSVSRDWPGIMVDRLETSTGAPILFYNGSFGDIAPRCNVGAAVGDGAPAAVEVGLRAATDALAAWRTIREFRDVKLATHSDTLALPLAPLPDAAEAEKELLARKGDADKRGAAGCEYHYWDAVLQAGKNAPRPSRDWGQTITQIGPMAIVPFAGEVFTEISLRLQDQSPYQYTLCAGTANGSHGYYVTREARVRGGYEPWVAKAYGAYILADDLDDFLVKENTRLLNELSSAQDS